MSKQQRCATCREPLGDSEATRIIGLHSGRVSYVHRPSTRGFQGCFPAHVMGRDQQRIEQVVTVDLTDPEILARFG